VKKLIKKNIRDIYALTPMQEGMLFHYIKNPDSGSYFEQLCLAISGEIPKELFEKAWNFVIETNEMLRTLFRWQEVEEPVQIVLKEHQLQPKYYDLSGKEATNKKKSLEEIKIEDRKQDFNLKEVPFRMILCKVEENEYVLIISSHHILYDGWSNGIILQEFFSAYNELSNGKEPAQSAKTKFKEFVKWNLDQDKNKQYTFWKRYLQGIDIPTVLPVKIKTRKKQEAWKTGRLVVILEENIIKQLRKLILKNSITSASFFYSSWGILLQRYCNNRDVIFGTTVSGRSAPIKGIENMVGLFINTIPLRVTAEAGEKIKDLIYKVNHVLPIRENYEATPLLDIKKYSSLENKEDFFDSIIVMENYPLPPPAELMSENHPLSLVVQSYEIVEMTDYDLTVGILSDNDIKICFNYNTIIFEKEAIYRLTRHFTNIIKNILKDVDNDIFGIEILTKQEKRQLLSDFNDTRADYPKDKTVIELLAAQVENRPFNTAVVFEDKQLTYHHLNKKSDRLSGFLKSRGVKPGDIVGIMPEPSIEVLTGIIGILKAGAAYLPIDPLYPKERKDFITKDSNIKVVLSSKATFNKYSEQLLSWNSAEISYIDVGGIDGDEGLLWEYSHDPGDIVYVIYTSGTTGKPKGVLIEHGNLVNVLAGFGKTYGLRSGIRVLQVSNFTFDPSVEQIFSTLLYGATLYMANQKLRSDIEELYRYIDKHRLHLINMVPTLLRELLAERARINSIHLVVAGGERLEDSLKEQLLEKGYTLYNHYGPTETTIEVLTARCSHEPVTLGKPIRNNQAYILDKTNHLQPLGVPGELCISGAGLARGYLNRPELTAEKFISISYGAYRFYMTYNSKKIYKTGDLARWLPDGNIEFLGRIDQQIKIRGFRIEPVEIENQLLAHGNVKKAVVQSKLRETGETYLCAYIVPPARRCASDSLDISQLRQYLAAKLPGYMVPSYFIEINRLPLTPNGKVDQSALPEPGPVTGKKYAGPGNDMERKLVEIWWEVLFKDSSMAGPHLCMLRDSPDRESRQWPIGIDDHFLAMGGHSLKAMKLVSRIHKSLHIDIPLAVLFEKPTIRELAEYIKKNAASKRYVSINPAIQKEYYPLSPGQRRLYFLQQVDDSGIGYNMPSVWVLEGPLDKNRLTQAFRQLIQRHESLRTSFPMVEDQPVQCIHEKVAFEIEYFSTGHRAQGTESTGTGIMQKAGTIESANCSPGHLPSASTIKNFICPFDLSRAPLLRVGLIKQAKQTHILLVDMHHIISDGISVKILLKEFMAFYSREELPNPRLQYKDYSEWQIRDQESPRLLRQGEYWKSKFQGEIPVLNLPTDYARPAVQSLTGSSLYFELSSEKTNTLKALSLQSGATMFMMLLGLYTIFLSKISSQEDIIIGTPVSGRRYPDLDQVIGIFINTLALRNNAGGDKTFQVFLKELKESTIEAFENQEYPFEDLVNHIKAARDTSRNPLFNTIFVFQNIDEEEGQLLEAGTSDLKLKRSRYENTQSKFDISLHCLDTTGDLFFEFEFCTKLFKKETIKRLILYFKTVISSVLNGYIEQAISGIEIIPNQEKRKILFDFNHTDYEYTADKPIPGLITETVSKKPDHTAVVFQDKIITYKALNETTTQLACKLMQRGVKPDIVVGIMVKRSQEMIVGIFAILKAGGAYLPIDPFCPHARVQFMIADSRANLLLTTVECSTLVKEKLNREIIYIEENIINRRVVRERGSLPTSLPPARNFHRQLAYIIYTSGTTGKPKGVMIQQGSLLNRLNWMQNTYPLEQGDTILHKTPFTFDVSVWELFWWAMKGARVCLLVPGGEKDPEIIANAVKNSHVTVIHFVPSMFAVFLDYLQESGDIKKLSALKQVITSGEALTGSHVKRFHQLFFQERSPLLANLYGPTEATIDVSYFNCSPGNTLENIPIGKPIHNNYLYIINKYMYLQPIGIPGELCIAGKGLARGYLNRPELTAEKFVRAVNGHLSLAISPPGKFSKATNDQWSMTDDRFYRTGDLARWLLEGNIEFLGRIDHQVKIRGFRIEPGEIENQLLRHEKIKEVIVQLREDETGNDYLVAYIVSEGEAPVPMPQWREHLLKILPGYMVPSYFVMVKQIPLTSSGKVDRRALPLPALETNLGNECIVPRDEIEKKLAIIWRDILPARDIGHPAPEGHESSSKLHQMISIDDNFFQLGGHSLTAITLVSRIHKTFNVKLSVVEMFKKTTIRGLSKYIKEAVEERYPQLELSEKKEYYGLSPAQKRLYVLQQRDEQSTVYNIPICGWIRRNGG
jgi:amino acid adenylation domain-containing protein